MKECWMSQIMKLYENTHLLFLNNSLSNVYLGKVKYACVLVAYQNGLLFYNFYLQS